MSRLTLPPEEMRRLGYRVIEAIVEHYETVADGPPIRRATREELEARLAEPPPAGPGDPEAAIERLLRDVLRFGQHGIHPRHFARIPSPSNFVGVLADALASGFNAFAGSWTGGAGAATVELTTIDWLRGMFGLPEASEGLFVSGGSVANLTALAAARQARLGADWHDAVVYCSDQTHASVARGLRVLGFAPGQLRALESDARLRLPVARLAEAIGEDRAAGRTPFCVVATAGSTNTGAVDPLGELADVCAAEGLWLHADAAYGGGAVLCERGRAALAGIERADSLAVDPHKLLFQPYEIGCVLVRHPGVLADAFALEPEYLGDVAARPREVNFFDRGIQLTRSARALKLWLTIQVFGTDALAAAVDHGIALAEHAERRLRERPGWEVVTPAEMAIVSFRRAGPAGAESDALHRALVDRLTDDGTASVSSTVLRGRTVLRLCTINPRTTEADVELALDRLAALAA